MLKFLRKYNAIILVIGGSLLMVVFLLQPVLNQVGPMLANRASGKLTATGETISVQDRQRAATELQILQAVAPAWLFRLNLDQAHDTDHWLLLTHEAEQAGLVSKGGDATSWFPELAQLEALAIVRSNIAQQFGTQSPQLINMFLSQPQTQQQIEALSQQILQAMPRRLEQAPRPGMTEQDLLMALAKARGVQRLVAAHNTAVKLSRQEAVRTASEALDTVTADIVVLPPEAVAADVAAPTAEEINAQWQAYRDTPPGTGEHGFGYQLPPRVKLAWVTIDPAAIESAIDAPRLAVRKRYTENTDTYTGEWDEVRDQVEADYRRDKAAELVRAADQAVRAVVLQAIRELPREDRYRALPADWSPPSLVAMADAGQAAMIEAAREDPDGILPASGTLPRPTVTDRRADGWLTSNDIQQIPSLGRAEFRSGAQRAPVALLPTLLRSAGGSPIVAAQVGVPIYDPVAMGPSGSLFYILVADARQTSPADELAEVEDRVREDLINLRALNLLEEREADLESLFAADGPDAVKAAYPEAIVMHDTRITRSGITAVRPGDNADQRANLPAVRDAVVADGESLDPLATAPEPGAVISVALPQQQTLVLARPKAHRPMTVQAYRSPSARQQIAQQPLLLVAEQAAGEAGSPFGYDELVKRWGYTLNRDDDDTTPEPQDSGESDTDDSSNEA